MIRSLTELLDEWMPIVAGSEINDDPFAPVSRHARDLLAAEGDEMPISWVHRDERFGEKLATPDTSIADLIGEVDPIKVAEGRYLSDELTLHYGLVPRTNRGIFAINELPDLAERIQVGLLNVLEERDVQVRGYKIRLPLDVMLFASANPEDYTNRGRIITPLKDRFGAQIRTHYPLDVDIEVDIATQEAAPLVAEGVRVDVPGYMAEIVATLSHLARQSPHINQRSGRLGAPHGVQPRDPGGQRHPAGAAPTARPRSCPGSATSRRWPRRPPARSRSSRWRRAATSRSSITCCRPRCSPCSRSTSSLEDLRDVLDAFDGETVVSAGDDVVSGDYVRLVGSIPALSGPVARLLGGDPATVRARGRRRGGGQRGRVRARGPAPVQAPQQGGRGRPGAVPGPLRSGGPVAEPSASGWRRVGPLDLVVLGCRRRPAGRLAARGQS